MLQKANAAEEQLAKPIGIFGANACEAKYKQEAVFPETNKLST